MEPERIEIATTTSTARRAGASVMPPRCLLAILLAVEREALRRSIGLDAHGMAQAVAAAWPRRRFSHARPHARCLAHAGELRVGDLFPTRLCAVLGAGQHQAAVDADQRAIGIRPVFVDAG